MGMGMEVCGYGGMGMEVCGYGGMGMEVCGYGGMGMEVWESFALCSSLPRHHRSYQGWS